MDDHLELFLQGTGTTGSLLPDIGEAELRYTYDPKDLKFRRNFVEKVVSGGVLAVWIFLRFVHQEVWEIHIFQKCKGK